MIIINCVCKIFNKNNMFEIPKKLFFIAIFATVFAIIGIIWAIVIIKS